MRSFLSRTIWPWAAAIAALALLAGTALAHDDRHVGGYKLNVGFNIEPAYEGVPNGIDIRVTRAAEGGHEDDHDGDGEGGDGDGHDSDGMSMTDEGATAAPAGIPVEGLEETLQVEVTHVPSGASRIMDLRPVFQSSGHYTADLIPTAPGVYRIRVFGSIGETAVDETFVSQGGGGGFSDVESKTALYFPEPLTEVRELESAVRGAVATAEQAQDTALAASTDEVPVKALAIVAIALGAVGTVIGTAAGIVSIRRRGA